jgi:release factor glutamine methyltransferase
MKLGETLAGVARELAGGGVESPRVEAEILLASVLGALDAPRASLFAEAERELSSAQARTLAALVLTRLSGVPVQYVVGRAWFRDLTLEVGRGVLVPRPETEILAGEVIAWLGRRSAARGSDARRGPDSARGPDSPLVLDLGTGSGAIALAVAAEFSPARVVASDLSPAALAYARRNRERVERSFPGTAARVLPVAGDGLAPFRPGPSFDAVVSNPPYVSAADFPALQREVREHEPEMALVAERGGLAALEAIVERAPEILRPGGLLALEVGEGQSDNVAARIAARGAYVPARVVLDLAGRPRVVMAERQP